tara:strand:+ start:1 stop:642 length:642 start_codon:yes stop_codon:yes gene_type:complete
MVGHDEYNKHLYSDNNGYRISTTDDGNNIISTTDIRLTVKSTTDSLASIKIIALARGSSYELARERAHEIKYNYSKVNNELKLDSYLITHASNKFSDQHIEVVLYLPEGTIFIANSNTQNFRRYYNSSNEILKRGMEDHFLKVIEDDVECLDCEPEPEPEPEPETKVEASVFESEESKIQESKIQESIIKESDLKESEINYEITEEDGVNIDN